MPYEYFHTIFALRKRYAVGSTISGDNLRKYDHFVSMAKIKYGEL